MAKRSKAGKSDKKNTNIDLPVEKVTPPPGFLQRSAFHLLIVVVIGFISYSNTLHSPFQWDDYSSYLRENPIIKNLRYFAEPSSAKIFRQYDALKSRYIGYLTFALNYRVHGFDVTGYHVVNLFVHITNAVLVYFLVLLTFRTPYFTREKLISFGDPARREVKSKKSEKRQEAVSKQQSSGFTIYDSRFIAFAAALLFVAHPVQTEAVTYIFQRLASLVTLFYLLSIVFYIKGRLKSVSTQSMAHGVAKHRPYTLSPILFYSLSLVSAVLAMKTKENAFTLPLVITLYEFLFFYGPIKMRLLRLLPLLLTLFIIPLTLSGIDKPAGEIISQVQSFGYQKISKADYLFTQFRVIVTYIRLLFLPIKQNIDYDYPLYHSFVTPVVTASFFLLLAIFGAALYLLYKTRSEKKVDSFASVDPPAVGDSSVRSHVLYRLIGFGIVWFFITLSIESSIIPIPMLIDEYRVYLPSVGVFTAVAAGIFMLADKLNNKIPRARSIAIVSFLLIAIVLSGATYSRNIVWMKQSSLWGDAAEKSPNKARPHNNLGTFYKEIGLVDQAFKEFQIALKLKPDYPDPHYNIGTLYLKFNRYDEAVKEFQTALRLKPDYTEAHNNLGNTYFHLRRFDDAVKEYQAALTLYPDFAEAHNNMGGSLQGLARYDEALREFQTALRLKPDYAVAHYNSGNAYFNLKRYDDAVREYRAALQIKPDYAGAHYNSGNAYVNLKRYDDAIREYRAALQIKPDYVEAYKNIGLIYKHLKRFDDALKEFQAALRLKPDYVDARLNLENLSREVKEKQRQ